MRVTPTHVWDFVRRNRVSATLGALAVAMGTAAIAAPDVREHARRGAEAVIAEAVMTSTPTQEEWIRVWNGDDVDGDGQQDFVNPTGGEVRGHDEYGYGEFGASRDGGSRRHEGVDFVSQAGQAVVAPISGYVTKIGAAYSGDANLKFVEITNPALNYVGRVFYVDPSVIEGQAVQMGGKIGVAHTLQRKYRGGMTDHVHLEIMDRSGRRIDATRVLAASYEKILTAG